VKLKKLKLFLMLALPLTAYTDHCYAQCARHDIDYYLNKGFTPEQITAICTAAPLETATPINHEDSNFDIQSPETFNNKITPNQIPDADQPPTTQKKNEQFLKEAIKGRNVILTENSLQYTLKVCIEYGEEDMYGFAAKACPIVKFVIARKGLEVIASRKKYIFFGDDEIKVKGIISREIIAGLEKNNAEELHKIQQQLESGDYTVIPVRDDISLDSVEQLLLQLAI